METEEGLRVEAVDGSGYEDVLSDYYRGEKVKALITLKVDTKNADKIATKVTDFDCVIDVFLVTGDVDIILRTTFNTYKELKEFIIKSLGTIEGVKETKTLMIVTAYKENYVKAILESLA